MLKIVRLALAVLIVFALAFCCNIPRAFADTPVGSAGVGHSANASGVLQGAGADKQSSDVVAQNVANDGDITIVPDPTEGSGQGQGGSEGAEGTSGSEGQQSSTLVAVLYNDGNLLIRPAQEGDYDVDGNFITNPVDTSTSTDGTIDESSGADGNQLSGVGGTDPSGDPSISNGANGTNLQVNVVQQFNMGEGIVSETENAPWYEKRGAIKRVTFGQGVRPTSMAHWFKGLSKLTSVDFCGLDTSKVDTMQGLFSDCQSLASLNVSQFNTSGVTNMASMFEGCAQVTKLDLSSFNTSQVTTMSNMFAGLASLMSVDVKSFDTQNVTDMTGMFAGCSALQSLNLSSFKTPKLQSLDGMFEGCTSLAALDVSGFTADQLAEAGIPLGNEGGYWRMNVPEDYNLPPGFELREATDEERAAAKEAGDPEPVINPDQPNPDEPDGPDNPDPSKPDPTVDPNGNNKQTPDANTNNQGVADNGASTSTSTWAAFGTDADDSSDEDTTQLVPAIDFSAVGAAVFAGLMGIGSDLAILIMGPTLAPGVDPAEVANATTAVLSAVEPAHAVDRTMAIATAIVGMILAAGILLTFCFKIR